MLRLQCAHWLQELTIGCIDYARNEHLQGPQPHFDTAPLAQLPRLARLELRGFSGFDLRGLPPSLRWLQVIGRLRYSADAWPAVEAWAVPESCSRWAGALAFGGPCIWRALHCRCGYVWSC